MRSETLNSAGKTPVVLPPGSCDAHAHVFGPVSRYPCSPERSFTPLVASCRAYGELLERLGFERAVLVQPSIYGTDNSCMTDAMITAKAEYPGIAWRGVAVVGSDISETELERLHDIGIRGVRLNLISRGADVSRHDIEALAEKIAPFGWHVQVLADISRFDGFRRWAGGLPVPVVVDHMGHAGEHFDPETGWFRDLVALLGNGRAWVKLSGGMRNTTQLAPPLGDVRALAMALMEAAPKRLVYGTDWPHVNLNRPTPDDGAMLAEFAGWADGDADLLSRILVENPAELYGF